MTRLKTPKRDKYIEKVAQEAISKLDLTFNRKEVRFIADWIKYLSTQD